jgi:glyoxylase-like metal-dependent hydrolase (beta-lactamase superfamily II)
MSPAATPEVKAELLKTGLYLLQGGGASALLRLNAAGSVLVNGKEPEGYRPLMSQIRRINKLSDLPVRAVIYSNHHATHAANHERITAAGIASLISERLAARLGMNVIHSPSQNAPPAAVTPPAGGTKPPGAVVTFADARTVQVGGVPIEVVQLGPAVTDTDTLVHFPDLKVLALGELGGPALWPDYPGGGSLLGWQTALRSVLALPFEMAVPSEGAVLSRSELSAFAARLDALIERARALARSNAPHDELKYALQGLAAGGSASAAPAIADGDVAACLAELARNS